MSTKQELIEWSDISGISIGRDERSPYPTLEQLAQFADLARAQPPAPEQQALQGVVFVCPGKDVACEEVFKKCSNCPAAPEAAKPLFADLIAATPGAAEELKAVDAQADEILRQAEAAKPVTERAELIQGLQETAAQQERCRYPIYGSVGLMRKAAALLAADNKAGGEPIPLDAISHILNCYMEQAVSNGANSVSMPDEAVAVAHFLSFPEKYTHPQQQAKPLTECSANRDGDCVHAQCPQLRDGEPKKSGRHCPLDTMGDQA